VTDVLRQIILPKLNGVRPVGGSFMARCPAHEDGTASLSISRGTTQPVIFKCHAGCETADILNAAGLQWADISNPDEVGPGATRQDRDDTWMPCGHIKVAEYPYRDQAGEIVFAVARCSKKGNGCQGFRQWRPDPGKRSGRTWSRNMPDGSRVGEGLIYRLPDVIASKPIYNVYIVEGEKDVDRLWRQGVPATCNPQGAGKWTPEHAAWLAGRDIVADRDDPGWKHAEHVANTLLGSARSIEILRAASGKDASDHFDAGGTLTMLVSVAKPKTPPAIGSDGKDVLFP
jgi:hypothetical protein